MIKELITISNDLDKRGLLKEANFLDKISADIINFEERARELRANRQRGESHADGEDQTREVIDFEDKADERRSALIEKFVKKNLSPDTKLYDEDGQSELSDYAWNNNEMLREYMIEVMPDLLVGLYEEIGDSDIQKLVRDVEYVAESLADQVGKDDISQRSQREDMLFIAKAMKHYLIDHRYDFGI